MPDENEREAGARVLKPLTGPDPSDAFSQTAAKNKKPSHGMGLTEESDKERSEIDKSDLHDSDSGLPDAGSEQFSYNHEKKL